MLETVSLDREEERERERERDSLPDVAVSHLQKEKIKLKIATKANFKIQMDPLLFQDLVIQFNQS